MPARFRPPRESLPAESSARSSRMTALRAGRSVPPPKGMPQHGNAQKRDRHPLPHRGPEVAVLEADAGCRRQALLASLKRPADAASTYAARNGRGGPHQDPPPESQRHGGRLTASSRVAMLRSCRRSSVRAAFPCNLPYHSHTTERPRIYCATHAFGPRIPSILSFISSAGGRLMRTRSPACPTSASEVTPPSPTAYR